MYHRILVPLDGSKHAESVLSLACTLASHHDAEITLLRVVEYPYEMYSNEVYSGYNSLPLADSELDKEMKAKKKAISRKAKAYLKSLASGLEASMPKVLIEIQEGPVVDAILRTVEKLEIDLIVMSTTGENRNPWMGAITNRILRESRVPVVLMRMDTEEPVPDRHDLRRIPSQKVSEGQYACSR